jgi:hypothetical protein
LAGDVEADEFVPGGQKAIKNAAVGGFADRLAAEAGDGEQAVRGAGEHCLVGACNVFRVKLAFDEGDAELAG